MRINWFSPVAPAQTAIADVTRRVVPALARRMEVTVWTDVPGFDPRAIEGVPIRSCRNPETCWPDINFADFSIYHIGNDARFHAHYAALLERHPGIVVLHDYNLHELHRERMIRQPDGEAAFSRYVFRTAGAAGLDALIRFRKGEMSFEEVVERVPLIESVTRCASGIIFFNEAMSAGIRPLTRAPLMFCPLPLDGAGGRQAAVERTYNPGGRIELVMFGFLNSPNRRLEAVLEAVAAYRGAPVRLTLFGHIEDRAGFERILSRVGAADRVRYLGYLSDEGMERLLRESHLAVNFRNPTRGESSDSLLKAWKYSLPMLVTDTGYYATLPAGVACPVAPGEEIPGLHAHLDGFRSSPESYFAIGKAGHALLRERHSAEGFAASLAEFLEMAEPYRLRSFVANYSRHLGARLRGDIVSGPATAHLQRRFAGELAAWIRPPGA